ncbi:hypothetical protein EUGRSUZ_B03658 [Eucalyptus grandis]|uniref:Uncharacterized protein n=2 Tax=Eucalyptus grandis TaxID=71139 RepID=A0ACC3LX80_EUCGR|nr:hypothetical protein EUGRSUZ_B03658 [Eucalyptus grandis]
MSFQFFILKREVGNQFYIPTFYLSALFNLKTIKYKMRKRRLESNQFICPFIFGNIISLRISNLNFKGIQLGLRIFAKDLKDCDI